MPGKGCFQLVYHSCRCGAVKLVKFEVSAVVVHCYDVVLVVPGEQIGCHDLAHLPTMSSICLHIPGQNKMSRALCLQFTMPMCPAWIFVKLSSLRLVEIIIFSHLKIIQLICDSSSRWFQNSETLWGHFLLSSGHPSCMTLLSCASCESFSVSAWISFSFVSLTGKLLYTVCTCMSMSSLRLLSLYVRNFLESVNWFWFSRDQVFHILESNVVLLVPEKLTGLL